MDGVSKQYKPLTVKLSPRAHAGLTGWCRQHGVSVTGTIEAVGELLHGGGLEGVSEAELIDSARRVDGERRSRRTAEGAG